MNRCNPVEIMNPATHIKGASNLIEHQLKNSVSIEMLMNFEKQGRGSWTISYLLNMLQEVHENDDVDLFGVLKGRKKTV